MAKITSKEKDKTPPGIHRKTHPKVIRKSGRRQIKDGETHKVRGFIKARPTTKGGDSDNDLVRWFMVKGQDNIVSDFDVVDRATAGVSRASFDNLALRLGVSKKTMAEDILSVSVKTIERKQPQEKLDKRTSSHAIEIARIIQHAYKVFENEEKVKRWLNLENRALGNRKPLVLLETFSGINLVNDVLGRIEEGVYS